MEVVSDSIEKLGFKDSGSVMFQVDSMPDTPEAWNEAIGELPFAELFGGIPTDRPSLVLHPDHKLPYEMVRRKDGSEKRDWWTPDHTWHFDGARWPIQPAFTVIGCVEAEPEAPGTKLLDTVKLLGLMEGDGFLARHKLTIESAPQLRSVFADSTYYRERLPYLRSTASAAEKREIDKRIRKDFGEGSSHPLDLLERHADKLDKDPRFKPKSFPLVRTTWLDEKPALFIDGGVRNSHIETQDGRDRSDFLHAIRQTYLTGETPFKLGLVRSIGWVANRCIIFPQIGTLHRAVPGNNHDRKLLLGFVTDTQLIDEKIAA